ncbi:MAG: DUF4230 domain-containing protein [Alistipes sp.]|nr:DUF4230 domain-containing protein [Alistipes sp.]
MGLVNNAMNSAVKMAKIKLYAAIVGVVVVVAALLLLWRNPFDWSFSLGNLFGGGGVKIENTANVVEKVKKISQFTTACYYEEYVLRSLKCVAEEKGIFTKTIDTVYYDIVLTVRGTVRAGYDLSKMEQSDITISGDTINVRLPQPEVLDVISNPSDYKIFEEQGEWSHEEIVAIQSEGKIKTLNNALKNNILGKANEQGEQRVANLFTAMGFKQVNVTTTPVPTTVE